jgi:hypothetical protein
MQINGNMMLAAQQAPAPAAQAVAPGFTSLLQKAAGFMPRDLTRPEPAPVAQADAKPAGQTGAIRPGMHIDLKI